MRLLLVLLLCVMTACAKTTPRMPGDRAMWLRAETLPPAFARLRPLAVPKVPPAPGEWLAVHEEPGQSLAEFIRAAHRVPSAARGTIVLTRLGNVSPAQQRVLAGSARYVEAFFGRPVRFAPDLDLAAIPDRAQRADRGFGLQLETRFILDSLLTRARPPDAFVYVALSTLDLYPQESWNFVFGQALPSEGVGVWSLARFGGDEPRLLVRTMRTEAHEIGHLLGLPHCIAYECLMNGSNSLEESDGRPLELCPVCMAKLCRSLDLDPAERAGRVAGALEGLGLPAEAGRERKMQRLLAGKAQE
jgi:archaemetzincin